MSETILATGTYTIENVDRRNDIFLADETLVAGSSELNADPPLDACWRVIRLRNGRFTISPASQQNLYASWPTTLSLGSAIFTSPTPHRWVVREARVKDTFVISHAQHQLYWGIEDDEEGTPVKLRHPPTGSGNQWRFHLVNSKTVTPQSEIESGNIGENVDPQAASIPTKSHTEELIDGRSSNLTPVVPQSVVVSVPIDGSTLDSQMTSTRNRAQTSEVIDDRSATSISVIPESVIESPNIDESPDYRTATLSRPREVIDVRSVTSTSVVPQSVVRSESPAVDGNRAEPRMATTPNRRQKRPVVDGRLFKLLPIVPQSVVGAESLAIDGSRVDCETASSLGQTKNRADNRPAIRHILKGRTLGVWSVAYSPNGRLIAAGSSDCTICVWDVQTRHFALRIAGHSGGVISIAFSPDGAQIASGSQDKTIRISDAQSGTLAWILNGHTNWVSSVAYSPNGKLIVSGSEDKTVRMWDAETGSLVLGPLVFLTGHTKSVDFSMDGKLLYSPFDGSVRVWDVEKGNALTFSGQSQVWSATFSPDTKQIVFGGADGLVTVLNMQSGDSIKLKGHKGYIFSIAFSPDGERIVSGGEDGQIIVWDARYGHALGRLTGHTSYVWSVVFSPDGKWIVSGSSDETVRIWEADRLDAMPPREVIDVRSVTSTAVIPQSVVRSESLAVDGSRADPQMATTPNRRQTGPVVDSRLFKSLPIVPQGAIESPCIEQTATMSQPREVTDVRPVATTSVVLQSGVRSEALAIGGSRVDCQGASSLSQTRNVNDDRPAIHYKLARHTSFVCSVAYSPDGKRIASGSSDCTICVWDVPTRCFALRIEGHTCTVLSVAFSPDSRRIISGSRDKTVRIWDAQSGTLTVSLDGHTSWVRSVACSPDGERVVSGSDDKTVRVWNVETGRLVLWPLLRQPERICSVHFSPNGKYFLCSSNSGDGSTLRVWDAETGLAIRTFHRLPQLRGLSAIFSPDSRRIVWGRNDGIVEVLDMQSGHSIVLRGHKDPVHSVGFSPNGERIVSGGGDSHIIVWDAKSGRALGRLTGHAGWVRSVMFSPDGKWIVSGSEDMTVRIWEADRLDPMPDRLEAMSDKLDATPKHEGCMIC